MSSQSINYPAGPSLVVSPVRFFSWSGIFAGTFLFLAIEATFGTLAAAIFGTPYTAGSINIGFGIWMVILSIIALYFGGKLASKISGTITRNIGMYAGLVTFGMSLFATILVMGFGGPVRAIFLLGVAGYWIFAALVLGMIAAAIGGTHGAWMGSRPATIERGNESKFAA